METVKLLQSSLVVERDLMSLNNFLLEFLIYKRAMKVNNVIITIEH